MGLPAKLCDVCSKPGACCDDFVLSLTTWADEGDEGAIAMRDRRELPFVLADGPIGGVFQSEEHGGRSYVQRRWRCPALSAGGRCTIYQSRPSPCRNYQSGSDALCVMWKAPAEAA